MELLVEVSTWSSLSLVFSEHLQAPAINDTTLIRCIKLILPYYLYVNELCAAENYSLKI